MDELRNQIRKRFLDRIDERDWDEEEPRLDFGSAALPYFMAALGEETNPTRRARLVRAIWQFRDPAALPTLALALRDGAADVWKEALDGFVTIGGSAALTLLREVQVESVQFADAPDRLDWIAEAIQQIEDDPRMAIPTNPSSSTAAAHILPSHS